LIQQVDKLNFNEEEEPENHQNQLQKTPEKDEYVYFMKEPKKKLILNYEICSYLMFKEGFKDCLCVSEENFFPFNPNRILISPHHQAEISSLPTSTNRLSIISWPLLRPLVISKISIFATSKKKGMVSLLRRFLILDRTLVISYYNWLDSLEAYQKLRTIYSQELAQNILRIEFLLPYNQNNFLDFIVNRSLVIEPLIFESL